MNEDLTVELAQKYTENSFDTFEAINQASA